MAQAPPVSAARPPQPPTPSSVVAAQSPPPTLVSATHPHDASISVAPTPAQPSSTAPRTGGAAGAAGAAAGGTGGSLQPDNVKDLMARLDRQMQIFLDRIAPHKLYRWVGLAVLLTLFLLRTFLLEGFYIVIYVLFIFILNQFILFLQPKDRASLLARATSTAEDDAPALPTADGDEFRPFVRRLPEFKFWYSTTYATLLAFGATFFKVFDVPVFWPVLLFYFIMLFVATMRRQWLDMKHLKYVPWDIGTKKVYKSDPKRVSVTRPQPQPAATATSAPARTAPVPTVQVKKSPALSQ